MDLKIEAQSDYLEKIAHAKPINAIAEMIWNSLDADASKITVKFLGNEIGTEEVFIEDNGSGFSYEMAVSTFSSLGGSWKREKSLTEAGRRLHGREGQGRFKAFSIGNTARWEIVYKEIDIYYEFTISGSSGMLNKFSISDKMQTSKNKCGVTLRLFDPIKQYKIFDELIASAELSTIYAPYLTNYPKVEILVGNTKIDPASRIVQKTDITIDSTVENPSGDPYSFEFEIYEWNNLGIREVFFCDSHGFPIAKYEKQIRGIGDYSYTGYIKSDYFSVMRDEGRSELISLNDDLVPVIGEAIKKLKTTFLDRYRDDQKAIIQQWKDDNVYPYEEGTVEDPIEEAEKKVFDIIAINLNEYIDDFGASSQKQKKLQFRLLQQAIEANPGNIGRIIEEVINLPKDQADELASLLEYTSLSSIISTSKIIADRMKFIAGFEEIVFDVELKQHLKERKQLHRILADNTWFFGDEYFLSVDDQSLTEVLKKYSEHLSEQIVIDEPVLRLDDSIGIIDLMFSKIIPRTRPDEAEFLVIELKAPSVKIGQKEINQIEGYAFAVANDERFRGIKSRWEFWVISSDMDDFAKKKANQRAYPKGTIYQNDDSGDNDITIKIRTWSEILAENKHKHDFVRKNLNLSISNDDGVQFLYEKYSKIFADQKKE